MRILDIDIPEEDIYDAITVLETVKAGYKDRNSARLSNGWKLSVSRFIESDGIRDYLKTALAVRMADYRLGVKTTALMFYPEVEFLIKQGQELLKYEDITVKSGNLFLIKKLGKFFISDGLNLFEIDDEERKKVAYAMKNRWYYKNEYFFITERLATFKQIPIKDPPKFYLLMDT